MQRTEQTSSRAVTLNEIRANGTRGIDKQKHPSTTDRTSPIAGRAGSDGRGAGGQREGSPEEDCPEEDCPEEDQACTADPEADEREEIEIRKTALPLSRER
jgi:hypothetical protein